MLFFQDKTLKNRSPTSIFEENRFFVYSRPPSSREVLSEAKRKEFPPAGGGRSPPQKLK